MSLQFIIDGYNVVKHAAFTPPKKIHINEPELLLAETVKLEKLCGSTRNTVLLVFDGYPTGPYQKRPVEGSEIIYSQEESADERIKKLAERAPNPKNVVVVSDDREIRLFVRSLGIKTVSVEQFLFSGKKRAIAQKTALYKADLTYSEMAAIDNELRKLWLGE